MVDAPPGPSAGPSLSTLLTALREGTTTPRRIAAEVADDLARRGDDGVWITTVGRDGLLARAAHLESVPDLDRLPLFGVPFAVKDTLDVAGLPTTAACPAYAYVPGTTAPAVAQLLEAGAVLVGKTNLDQFATGLNGTRSPYGVPANVFGRGLIPGGSSSGSAVAVATGVVPVALATDTAGSGRVPAALNGILGLKPTRGLISTVGLVPACRSLDCVSLMARSVADLRSLLDVVAAVDPADPWSRRRQRRSVPAPRIGLPPAGDLEFLGDEPMRRAHLAARAALPSVGPVSEVPLAPFLRAGELLYQGPWVAERLLQFADFLATDRDAVHPVVAGIIEGGAAYSAVDVFRAQYRLAELRAEVDRLWAEVDVVVLPTIPTTFTVAEVLADPIGTNTALGTYTHCGNLLDLCAVAVPAGLTEDGRPCSLMVLGPAGADDVVLDVAARLLGEAVTPAAAAPPGSTDIAVVGHHLAGQPRNGELTDRGGELLARTTTTADHRLLRADGDPPVPALVRTADGSGAAIEVEVWRLPVAELPGFLAGLPDVLALGRVPLADGRTVPGLVADGALATGAAGRTVTDITAAGGWRAHLARSRPELALPAR
ncbi:allophanate hydrolase [Trujillonella endophytica]|uniref:Allophanate hydrolase n=1 Tax=Trujillonella endophytica TaxID=673521 RepID=A0A1H8TM78_9ACTN|nr:allophanate hydrolase [Trujillella endophytica]SEO92170.1 allophanate hydrolase [Trujillella endophytica]